MIQLNSLSRWIVNDRLNVAWSRERADPIGQMGDRFGIGRSSESMLTRLQPVTSGFLCLAGLRIMLREELGLTVQEVR